MKQCNVCLQFKELDEFGPDKKSKDGHTFTCRPCKNERGRNYYWDNKNSILQKQKEKRDNRTPLQKEKTKAQRKKTYESNKDQRKSKDKERSRLPHRRFTQAKHGAKKRHIEWNLSIDEFISVCDLACYYCSNELGAKVKSCAGLDRIDNDLGYDINNVLPCCHSCNKVRCDVLTVEETKIAIMAVLNFRKHKIGAQ